MPIQTWNPKAPASIHLGPVAITMTPSGVDILEVPTANELLFGPKFVLWKNEASRPGRQFGSLALTPRDQEAVDEAVRRQASYASWVAGYQSGALQVAYHPDQCASERNDLLKGSSDLLEINAKLDATSPDSRHAWEFFFNSWQLVTQLLLILGDEDDKRQMWSAENALRGFVSEVLEQRLGPKPLPESVVRKVVVIAGNALVVMSQSH